MRFPLPTPVAAAILAPFTLIAAASLVLAWRGQQRFMRRAHKGLGVVQGHRSRTYGQGQPLLFPIIQFKTDTGATISAESKTGANPSPYAVGQRVQILYDPANPNDMRPDSFVSRWIGVMIAAFFLFGCLVLGMALLLKR